MKTRQFYLTTRLLPLIVSLTVIAQSSAQSEKATAPGFTLLNPPLTTHVARGQVEVIEYFSYGCPYCYALEPYIVEWLKRQSADVTFRRIPVAWDRPERIAHARLFFALQKLNRMDLHDVVFETIHSGKTRLFLENDELGTLTVQRSFVELHGVDGQAFEEAYRSATELIDHANSLAEASHVEGVPSMLVAGKYLTDVRKTHGQRNLIALVDHLIACERRHEASTTVIASPRFSVRTNDSVVDHVVPNCF